MTPGPRGHPVSGVGGAHSSAGWPARVAESRRLVRAEPRGRGAWSPLGWGSSAPAPGRPGAARGSHRVNPSPVRPRTTPVPHAEAARCARETGIM
ncbi:hypothetical protein SHJG_5909 [Streptomyces hygroscopicus subsp. jinggangensis 5008]|nr:hypothetical protein SHJG_5909 [Streptomyces hygroscopicus subsp. jinggangensis 5008]AGF65334.1 hypothetical protein SHJGH_5671 [Streptomyces hygroscopicus subsp. jinggangensis TL01]